MNLSVQVKNTFMGASTLVLSLFALSAFALNPALPPSGNFDLLGWYLNTPEDVGGISRRIDEVDLANGFVDNDYFWTAADGGMVFKVTNAGATTSSGAIYPRTELRQMLRRGDTSINTKNSDGTPNLNNWVFSSAPAVAQNAAGEIDGEMKATLAVNAVTTTGEDYRKGRVIVGQIHAKDDEPIRLYYRKLPGNTNGSIYAAHESKNTSSDIYYEILGSRSNSASNPSDGIALDELWSYEILVVGNQLTVTIRSGDLTGPVLGTADIDMSSSGYDVADDFMYFKVGAYNQNNDTGGGVATDFAQATFYALEVDHYDTGDPVDPVDPNPGGEIVNDSFADGDRTKTGSLDADWWSSSQSNGSNVQDDPNALTLVTGTSGRGMHATFAPQTLAVGESITATYSFTTPATIGTNRNTAFKVALMDLDDPALAADQSSSSSSVNPLYVGQPGYFVAFDVDGTGGGSQDTEFRKHNTASGLGRFLGTTGEWSSMSSSGDAGYAFTSNTDYVGVYTITRTGTNSVELSSTLSLVGGALLDSHTANDSSAIANNFGMLGIWVNSNTFGSSNSAGASDNGLIFTNVLISGPAAQDPCIPSQFGIGCTTDTDGDGKTDAIEGELTDTDADGTPDYLESALTDIDSDGVVDELDTNNSNPCTPSQFASPCTLDTDGDGDTDPVEGEFSDGDGDGVADYLESSITDSDNDGVVDELDPANADACVPSQFSSACTLDTDGDGDSDTSEGEFSDTDSDGVADYLESSIADLDLDGLADEFDPANANPCMPSQFASPCTLDTDSDGTTDANEGETPDADADGTPDYLESSITDADLDGVADQQDPSNNDPCVPSQFASPCTLDTDGDGTTDATEGETSDTDADGTPDYLESSITDADLDNVVDQQDPSNNDPCVPSQFASPCTLDTDGDGKTDANEGELTDTDGDGAFDYVESFLLDADGDGVVDELDSENNNPCAPDISSAACGIPTANVPLPLWPLFGLAILLTLVQAQLRRQIRLDTRRNRLQSS